MKWILTFMVTGLTLLGSQVSAQQNYFSRFERLTPSEKAYPLENNLKSYSLYYLDEPSMKRSLENAPIQYANPKDVPVKVTIPLPNGIEEVFLVYESPVLAPHIANQYPDIKTYEGRGTKNPSSLIRFSFTVLGFNAIILGLGNDAVYFEKAEPFTNNQVYISYFGSNAIMRPKSQNTSLNKCGTQSQNIPQTDPSNSKPYSQGNSLNKVGGNLRTFKIAITADTAFCRYKGNNDRTTAYAAVVGFVNRMIAVYKVELSVTFTLISTTNSVFVAPNNLVSTDQSAAITQNQQILDSIYGNANYDVGHVLGASSGSGGGIAQSSSVCVSADKAKGITQLGDGSFASIFDDQTFNHEVGHQFSMSHSYNSSIPVCTTREAATSVEVGSGTTIMSYGYTCSGSGGNDDYESPYTPILNFHTVNYSQAITYIGTISCFTSVATGNNEPVITSVTSNKTIPRSTPFALTGAATDANTGNSLTYSWEGTNIGTTTPVNATFLATDQPPFFRTYAPVSSPIRYYPRLSAILDGTNAARGDKLPSVAMVTTHKFTVRDNVDGSAVSGVVTITVDGASGPFLVTSNLTGTLSPGSSQTITWSVNNTTAAPVSCANVDILLSIDGGTTFPYTLASSTANDGTEVVTLPLLFSSTSSARIKVQASDNIFFDISNSNFSIAPTNYYSKSTGSLSDLTTWGTSTDGTGANPPNFTETGAIFNLANRGTAYSLTASLTIGGGILIVPASATLSLGTNNLSIAGLLNNNGTISGAGNVILNGTTNQTISGNGTIQNLTLNNAAGATISSTSSSLSLSGLYTKTAGNLTTNGNLILLSTASGTAAIGQVTAGSIAGNVTVQRYIPNTGGRKYRYLAAPFSTGPTISSSWQQRIFISGSGTGGTLCPSITTNSNGFDRTTNNAPSMFTFKESTANYDSTTNGADYFSNAWTSVPNTTGTNLTAGVGYNVFIRGDRSQGCSTITGPFPTPSNLTLSATGAIQMGNFNFTVTFDGPNTDATRNGWNLVGNPYPSEIDWDAAAGWTKDNISNTFYIYNPQANNISAYSSATGGVNGGTRYIPSGMAFFVKAEGSTGPTLAFSCTEAVKSNTGASPMLKNKPFDIKLKLIDANGFYDESIFLLNHNKTDLFDKSYDIEKMGNPSNVNIYSIDASNKKYALNAIATIQDQEEKIIPLGIGQANVGTYDLEIEAPNLPSFYQVFLRDHYLQTETQIFVGEKIQKTFSVNSQINSAGNARFDLVISNNRPHSTGLYALENGANQVSIYPNPSSDKLNILIPNKLPKVSKLKLVNTLGQIIMEIQNPELKETLDISYLKPGVYFLEIYNYNNEKFESRKVVKW